MVSSQLVKVSEELTAYHLTLEVGHTGINVEARALLIEIIN